MDMFPRGPQGHLGPLGCGLKTRVGIDPMLVLLSLRPSWSREVLGLVDVHWGVRAFYFDPWPLEPQSKPG